MITEAQVEAYRRDGFILASTVGSALEWYDFFLYGTAAALVFGEAFFPKYDPMVSTLLSFATFGVGFVALPFGGLLFGYLGDHYGRKPVLIATLLLVGIGTMLIGCLPTYAMVGVWAPIGLVLLRLIQGFGAGAEYGGAVIMLVEYAPRRHRGLWGGFASLGVSVGNLLAAGAFAAVSLLPREDFMAWGWRVPFLLSIVLVLVGLYIRYRVMETPVFRDAVARRAAGAPQENPLIESIRKQPRNFLVLLGARIADNGLGYLFPVFGLSYVTTTLGVDKSTALSALMVAYVVELFAIPAFSALSDRVGRRPVYLTGALSGIALAFPFFWLVGTREWALIALAFVLAGAGHAAMFGPQASYFAELFAPKRRYSGFAFARELGSIVSGGPAPFVASALVAWAGGAWWPVALYIALLSGITAFAVWCGPETYHNDISADADEKVPTMTPRPAPA